MPRSASEEGSWFAQWRGAYCRDNPNEIVQFLDTEHFALETDVEEIAFAIRQFLSQEKKELI
jgi:hypothetical protein